MLVSYTCHMIIIKHLFGLVQNSNTHAFLPLYMRDGKAFNNCNCAKSMEQECFSGKHLISKGISCTVQGQFLKPTFVPLCLAWLSEAIL